MPVKKRASANKGGNAHNDKLKLEGAEKRKRALQLRIAGFSCAQIGEELGVNASTVHYYIQKAVKEIPKEEADEWRAIEMGRLDRMQTKAEEVLRKNHVYVSNRGEVVYDGKAKVIDDGPILQAINTVLGIMKRRAQMLGLDSPTKIEQSGSVEVTTGYDLSKITDPEKVRQLMDLLAEAETDSVASPDE
jgi:hypothetical protein